MQLCILPPRTLIPLHKHHNVRNQITFLHGHVVFKKQGKEIELNSYANAGRSFIIEPDEEHGAETFEQYCVFITEQFWLDGEEVKSLHLQWSGPCINKEHEEQLNSTRN